MKVNSWLVSMVFFGVSVVCSLAQYNCAASSGVQQPLVCLVPFSAYAYTGAGTLQSGQALAAALQPATIPINGAIAAQISQLPVPSGTSGTIYLKQEGVPQGRLFEDLGPILADRPETIGPRHFFVGFTYQHFNFNSIDGNSLGNLKLGFAAPDASNPNLYYYGSSNTNVKFKLDQYVTLLTYGATRTTDLSIVIPVNSVSVSATPSNTVVYEYNKSNTNNTPYIKFPPLQPLTNSGSATGIGDIKFGVKQLFYGQESDGQYRNFAISGGADFRIPSGYAANFLGSGAYGFDIYGLISYRTYKSRFSPHFKLGKQWNGPSPLVNSNSSGDARLPGGMQYDAGADVRIYGRKLTLSIDVIGNQFVNGTSLKPTTITLNPPPPTTSDVPTTLSNVALPVNDTYTTVSFNGGLKYNPTRQFLIYGNVLVQTNNVGLRSDPVPLAGISYNFNLGKIRPE